MRARPVNTCLVFLFLFIYLTTALEANMKEPTCDELRAMWRFSKRQSRAVEITNEIPTYKDPFAAYNVWEDYARPRSAGWGGRSRRPLVYGKIIHSTSGRPRISAIESYPERNRAFEDVMRLFGSPILPLTDGVPRRKVGHFRHNGGGAFAQVIPAQSSFQHLKELIRNERARELQEQRMSELAERNKYHRMNDSPPINVDNVAVGIQRDKPAQGKGVVAFPNILGPASYNYMEQPYVDNFPPMSMNKYRHKYPEGNSEE